MRTVRTIVSCLVAGVALLTAAIAAAQTTPVRLRGAITAIDGSTVTLAVRDGSTAKIKLADN